MNNNYKPLFADFFYAVVVGSAFTLILPSQSLIEVLVRIFLMIVILEDWYAYYRYVLPIYIEKKLGIDFLSLLMEFAMLLFWYLAFTSVPNSMNGFLIMFGLFFLGKLVGGMMINREPNKFFTWKVDRDFNFLFSILTCVLFLVLKSINCISDILVYLVVGTAWLLQTLLWWRMKPKKAS